MEDATQRKVYWNRGDTRIPCFYCFTWGLEALRTGDGRIGDIALRPEHLGPGEFTFTVAPDTVENEDGTQFSGGRR